MKANITVGQVYRIFGICYVNLLIAVLHCIAETRGTPIPSSLKMFFFLKKNRGRSGLIKIFNSTNKSRHSAHLMIK